MRKQFWEGMFRSFGTGARAHPSAVRAARLREGGPPIAPEDLEARRHLSVSTSLSGGVLTVTGDSNAQEIIVWRSTGPGTDTLKVREILNGNENDSVAYQTSQVNSISVSAGSGNDTITVETNALNPLGTTGVGKPVTAFGQDGDDTINGGDGADDLHGDYGNDTIYGRDGNDTIKGEFGSDPWLDGGDGNDLICGGYGDDTDTAADTLIGGNGNDTLRGEGGDDYLRTDPGTDSAYGGAGSDTFDSGDNDPTGAGDYLDGGADSDVLASSDSSDTTVSIP
jgi:Ca2+-binding RTX toxin-like protein